MATIRQLLLRILSTFRNSRAEGDLAREVNAHLALLEEKFIADGLAPVDARLAARRAFGGIEQAKEHHRDARAFRWIDDLQRDVRYAFRSLRRSPSFTIAAVLTLAIGIGTTTAIYSVVNTVLLSPLPFERGDRLVRLAEPELPRTTRGITYNEYLEWRRRTTTLSGMSALLFNPQAMMPTREGTARLTAAIISANYFDVFGMTPVLGRVITQSDEANPDVIVLSYDTWRRYFRGEPNAIGSVIELRGSLGGGPSNLGADSKQPPRLLTIVGVLPDVYQTNGAVFDVYTPFAPGMFAQPPGAGRVHARLRDGVSLAAAEEEANVIGNALRPARPATEPPLTKPRFELVPVEDEIVEPVRPALRVFLVAVGVMLLIVCANVANLLLARGASRSRELAVRLAVGASRARLVRQIFTECLVLSAVGGAFGAALGAAGVQMVKQLATVDAQGIFRLSFGGSMLPRINEIGVDASVLGVALALSMIACLVFGLLPSLQLSRIDHVHAMGTRGSGATRAEARTRTALVVSQLVLATVLLVSAGLLVNSFLNLSRVEKGYDPANALAFQLVLPPEYATERKAATIESVIAALEARPEVQHAGFAYGGILLGVEDTAGTFTPAGRAHEDQPVATRPRLKSLTHGYLKAMGATLLSGRHLTGADDATAPTVVVVNRTVASRFFGAQSPVGETLIWRPGKIEVPVQIVGVVEDVRQNSLAQPMYAEIFMDYRQVLAVHQRLDLPKQRVEQMAFGFMSFGVRTHGDPRAFIPGVRSIVRATDPNATLDAIHPMEEMVGYSTARQRFYAVLLGVFAAVAGVLAAIGIYGVLAYSVVQRTQEIGIRMALGAERRQVLALVMRHGVRLAAIGIVIGLAGAFAGARYLQSMLYGIEPRDPGTFAAVAGIFAVVALAAAYLPARRATRVDPMVALRVD